MRLWRLGIVLLSGVFFLHVQSALADSHVVITNPAKSSNDKRFEYPRVLLAEVLRQTQTEYGPAVVERYGHKTTRKRALIKLRNGEIHVFSTPARTDWEASVLPVRIPIRKGILGFKILLIRGEDQGAFSQVQRRTDLNNFRLGGGSQWSSTQAFARLGMKSIGGVEYEPLFEMLSRGRFDYFPRGVNEVFREYEDRKHMFENLKIEKDIALYLPQPTYFFVSPHYPELAKRIEKGLEMMIQNGTLDQLFEEYHGAALDRAQLAERRIIKLDNKTLSPQTPFERPELWLASD